VHPAWSPALRLETACLKSLPIKTFHFGPHGNFGPFLAQFIPYKPLTLDRLETLGCFFRGACFHESASYRKMKKMKVVEKLQLYKFGSVHLLVHDFSEEATALARKSPKFP
jgi:hypothetical protein